MMKRNFSLRTTLSLEKGNNMSLIIKEEKDLKDPFICFNVFMNYCKEAGEDYIDYNDSIPAAFRMQRKTQR